MINRKRMLEEFKKLTEIDSLSLGERQMADFLKQKLEGLGLEVHEDDAGEKLGGNSGNLIAVLKGAIDKPAILLSAHMDTVSPGCGKKVQFRDGVFYSDKTTILGADNAAAIEIILEALRVLSKELIEHGDIVVVFSVAEELALMGSNSIDFSKIKADFGIVLDCAGKPGTIALRAPAHFHMDVVITGKAAHAGIEPEKGISAVKIAGEAIARMKVGRVNDTTTANIGMISGGSARNTICDHVELKCEARSLDEQELKIQLEHMEKCFKAAADLYKGRVNIKSYMKYPVLDVKEDSRIIDAFKAGAEKCALELNFISTGGGSDANIFANRGIKTVNMAIGMENIHTVEESISLSDIIKSTELLLEVMKVLNN